MRSFTSPRRSQNEDDLTCSVVNARIEARLIEQGLQRCRLRRIRSTLCASTKRLAGALHQARQPARSRALTPSASSEWQEGTQKLYAEAPDDEDVSARLRDPDGAVQREIPRTRCDQAGGRARLQPGGDSGGDLVQVIARADQRR